MRKPGNKTIIKGVFILVLLYLAGATGATGWVIGKYYIVKPRDVEPRKYNTATMGSQEYDHPIRIFSPGLKDIASRKISDIVASDKNVVIMIGDSMTWGLGVEQNETIFHHLNTIDPGRKYINLSLPGANLVDSVERFYKKIGETSRPAMVMVQILLINDIAAGQHLEGIVQEMVERDYRYVLFPYSLFLSKKRLIVLYLSKIWDAIYADLTDRRFETYISKPLERLMTMVPPGTRLIVIEYSEDTRFKGYNDRLRAFCSKRGARFLLAHEVLGLETFTSSRQPDGHPTARFNEELAPKLKAEIDSYWKAE